MPPGGSCSRCATTRSWRRGGPHPRTGPAAPPAAGGRGAGGGGGGGDRRDEPGRGVEAPPRHRLVIARPARPAVGVARAGPPSAGEGEAPAENLADAIVCYHHLEPSVRQEGVGQRYEPR